MSMTSRMLRLTALGRYCGNMDAFANILTDFSDLSNVTGTYDITPINDHPNLQLTFEVVDSHGQTASKTIVYEVFNVNDAPVICDARNDVDPDCDNGDIYLYADAAGDRYNSRDEGSPAKQAAKGC